MQLLQHFKELTINPKNVQELKGLILQLAIQGKLTTNWRKENSNISDSKSLLSRIKEYNTEQLKVNKRRVSIPKGDLKDLQYLPKGWIKVANYDLFNLQKGRNPKDLSETVKTYPYHDIESLDRGNVRRYSNDEKAPKCKDTDILVVCDGSRSGLMLDGKPGIVGSTLAIIHTPPFIKDFIKLIFLQDFERANANMIGAAIPHLNTKGLLLTTVGLPPLEEQKEIVKVVQTLFKEVEQLEQLTAERIGLKEDFVTSALNQLTTNNANQEWTFLQDQFKPFFNETKNIKKLRETVLQLSVQGKLTADWRTNNQDTEDASVLLKRIQKEKAQLIKDKKIKKEKALPPITKEEITYELPEGWVWCRLGNYVHYGALNKCENKDASKKTWVLELEDVEKESSKLLNKVRFSERDFKSTKSVFKSSNVIYGKLRPYLDKVIVADEDGVCTTEMIPIKSFSNCNPEYLRWFLKNPSFIEYANGSTHGMRMPRMGRDVAKNAIISVPPLEEQKAIVEKVNALMGLCDKLEQEVKQSQEYSSQLMQSCLREVFEPNNLN
jgi:type I restriction enzyme S subunit